MTFCITERAPSSQSCSARLSRVNTVPLIFALALRKRQKLDHHICRFDLLRLHSALQATRSSRGSPKTPHKKTVGIPRHSAMQIDFFAGNYGPVLRSFPQSQHRLKSNSSKMPKTAESLSSKTKTTPGGPGRPLKKDIGASATPSERFKGHLG